MTKNPKIAIFSNRYLKNYHFWCQPFDNFLTKIKTGGGKKFWKINNPRISLIMSNIVLVVTNSKVQEFENITFDKTNFDL